MEIYQIKVFLEVARHLSFTEAADALNLTQPAVSAKIKSLESELGTSLFHRLGRRVELTRVGQYLLKEGPYLVNLESRLLDEIAAIKQGKFSNLKIGCTAEILDCWLPRILFEYRCNHSGIQTKCLRFDAAEPLYRAITDGEVDLGISDLSFADFGEISETVIDTVHYQLAVAADHPLAQVQWLSLKALRDRPWVLLPEGSPSRIVLEQRLSELGLSLADFPQIEMVDTPGLLRTYLLQGQYLSFVSDFELQVERQTGLIKTVPLEEFALGAHLFLLLPKRLHQSLEKLQQKASRGQPSLEPIQQFVALLQSRYQRHSLRSIPVSPSPLNSHPSFDSGSSLPKAAHFQSPSFTLRAGHSQRTDTLTLSIGTQHHTIQTATAGLIVQRLGLLEHFLPRQGRYSGTQYQIQWWDYSSGAPIVAGLHSKQLDIGILGDYPLLLSAVQQETGQTRLVSFVASNPDGSGNDVIVPHQSHLNSLEDLQGRVIAVPFGSAAHGMMLRSLHRKDLLDEVTLTSIDNLSHRQIGRHSNQVDGYAYFAPLHEIAKHQGRFRRLLEGNLGGLPTFHGVVVQESLAEDHPDIVIAYLKALLAAQYWYTTTPLAPSLVSQWVNLDPAIVSKTLSPNLAEIQQSLFFPDTQIRADWIGEHIAQLAAIAGNEPLSQINLNQWVQPDFLQSALNAF